MPQKEKIVEYEGRLQKLYGIRLRTKRDLTIKNQLKKISLERNVAIDKLMLDYLEKALETEIDAKILLKDFSFMFKTFITNSSRELDKLENQLKMKDFNKKDTLKRFLYSIFPDKIQRKKFYLELLTKQITCELVLLEALFSLRDVETGDHIGYYTYHYDCSKMKNEEFNKSYQEILQGFYKEWYYLLKTFGIVNEPEDLINANINYMALENFIFEIYKGKKIFYSKEKEEQQSIQDSPNLLYAKKEIIQKRDLYRLIDILFRHLFQVHGWDVISNLSRKIGLKPHVVSKILDLEKFFEFLKTRESDKSFSKALQDLILLYMSISNTVQFPPMNLIFEFDNYVKNLQKMSSFIKMLPLKIDFLSTTTLMNAKQFLERFISKDASQLELYQDLVNNLPIKEIDKFFTRAPKNISTTLDKINSKLFETTN